MYHPSYQLQSPIIIITAIKRLQISERMKFKDFKDQLNDKIRSENIEISRRTVKIVTLNFAMTIASVFDILGSVKSLHARASQEQIVIAHANKFQKISQKLR